MDASTWPHLMAIAAGRHGVLSRADLGAAGIGPDRLRRLVASGHLARRGANAFVAAGAPPTWEQSVVAAQVDVDGVVSHHSAAAIWRFDTFGPGGPPHVTIAAHRRVVRAGVVVHLKPLDPRHITRLGPFRLTTPTRTLLDLAGEVRARRLEHALDGALRDRRCRKEELQAELGAWRRRGRSGVVVLEALLGGRGVGPGPESVLERMFLRVLHDHGLPMPELQVVHDGGRIRVDAQYHQANVVIELDGHATHSTRRQRQRDAERRRVLAAEGIHVLPFTYEDVVERPARVAADVAAALRSAAA